MPKRRVLASSPSGDGLLVILRGVNLNPGADPEDMVSIRLWIERTRVISFRRHHLMAVEDLKEALDRGTGPTNAGEFLVALCGALVARVGGVLEELHDALDGLEEEVLSADSHDLRPKLANLRRQAIALRRYLAPQREALSRLLSERVAWLEEAERARLREIADRTTRYVEDLDSARDRAAVTQEELASRLAEAMNQKMYVVALVAAIFLPLGLLTGLLGINVGGIPGPSAMRPSPWSASSSWHSLPFCSGHSAAATGCRRSRRRGGKLASGVRVAPGRLGVPGGTPFTGTLEQR